ncbi:MAG: hypothetical protein DSY83_09620 [Flavobacteriia bacterium]|nr:MAG: hypothetical protein DSY83_09620 [Flavobacteriia bacterium]
MNGYSKPEVLSRIKHTNDLKLFGYGKIGNRNIFDNGDLRPFPAHHLPVFLWEWKFPALKP